MESLEINPIVGVFNGSPEQPMLRWRYVRPCAKSTDEPSTSLNADKPPEPQSKTGQDSFKVQYRQLQRETHATVVPGSKFAELKEKFEQTGANSEKSQTVSEPIDQKTSDEQPKKKKRVSFSLELEQFNVCPPVPKPRTSLIVKQVTVEEKLVEPEKPVIEKIPSRSGCSTEKVDKKKGSGEEHIEFAKPEDRHIIECGSTTSSTENIVSILGAFEMEPKKKSNSFKSKFLTIFSKDKEKKSKERDIKEEYKKTKTTKKTENAVFADNAQNESFNRHSGTRHTLDIPHIDHTHNQQQELENRFAAMHVQRFQDVRNSFANNQHQQYQNEHIQQQIHQMTGRNIPNESSYDEYIAIDENVPQYDTSSTNTIGSEHSTTSVNPLEQIQKERMVLRNKFFTEIPSSVNGDNSQNIQLVNPKASIPINSERPLPNPYQQAQVDNEFSDGVYGTYTRPRSLGEISDKSNLSSPRSPTVERTKLKLPINREKIDLQPRITSPIPPNEVSTDKLIATELLKNKKSSKKDNRTSPSHQKLELDIDYPDEADKGAHFSHSQNSPINMNNLSSPGTSSLPDNNETPGPENMLEAAEWHRIQRELNNSPSLKNGQITTKALVHVDSPVRAATPSQDGRSRSVTPVMATRLSNTSLQKTPPKHEIRQSVEAYCWKELKKLKEKEDQQMYMLISACGYAEDPVRRSRSMAPTMRDNKRSTSLPREPPRKRVEDVELSTRRQAQQQRFQRSPQRSTFNGAPSRPIFNRGSLTKQTTTEQPIYSKKVSFHSARNPENPTSWPTKNGFTQSPPQRRLDGTKQRDSCDDEVSSNGVSEPTREEIFIMNQQRQKEIMMAKAQKSIAPMPNRNDSRNSVTSEQNITTVDGSVMNEVPPMRNMREPIYGTRTSRNPSLNVINENYDDMFSSIRNGCVNESPYGIRTQDSPQSSRNGSIIDSPYGMNSNTSHVSRASNHSAQSIGNGRVINDGSSYGARPLMPVPVNRVRPMPMPDSVYGTKQEVIYGTRQALPQAIYGNMYGPRLGSSIATAGGYQESVYGTRQTPNAEPIYGSRTGPIVRTESPYGVRPSSNQSAQYYGRPPQTNGVQVPVMRSHLQRSQSLRAESLYGGPPNYNKPPSGIQTRHMRADNLVPTYAYYDYTPDSKLSSPQVEPIYGQRVPTVKNKVCDMYGRIHDVSIPKSTQNAGVLYGQLQRNVNAGPIQHQSYQQLQAPNNFVRGTRLTASVNDVDRYMMFPGRQQQRTEPPNRPLPPLPDEVKRSRFGFRKKSVDCGSRKEEEWNSDGKRGGGLSGSESGGRSDTDGDLRSRSRNNRREDPRRHTLTGEQYGVMSGQGGPLSRTMDLEGQPRGYPPPSNAMLFDDDPGIMSEVETSSTGFRRGGKQRSSLPVVRTPSKTLERPLGLVFLQYRNETKRALLPNEITSIDTVKALFVRSFPKQLTMEYLDSPQVKIYIHDSSKDMFYELEDLRSHLREIRDRSVLRLFESADVSGGLPMAGIGIAGGAGVPHFEDPSYFSEPEFDSEYQHQHIHKSKGSAKGAPYYIGSTASLPRAGLLRAYSPAVGNLPQDRMKTLPTGAPPKPQRAYSSGASRSGADGAGARATDRFAQFAQRPNNSLYNIPDGYMSSPERGSRYEEAYYTQYGTRSGSITPVIDEEVSDTELIDDQYSLYGVKMAPPGGPRPAPRTQFSTPAAPPYDATRIRVENMERQLANLTGLVQKALTQTPATLQVPSTGRDSYRDDTYVRTETKPPKLGKSGCHKSVSFEKSVSFSDEPPDMNSPKQHSPQHSADTKPTKPAIKSSTLPRTSSQERDRLKPAPPPKPASLSPGQYDGRHIYRDLQLTPEMYNQLRGLQKKAKDLRAEVRNLRRMSQAQAHSVRETIRDTFIKIRAMLMVGGEQVWQAGMDEERVRLSREEDLYKQEMIRLETDLSDLESTVEELRGNVINRKTRVNMSDVENMALILSKSSKTVADLKLRFPMLQDGLKSMLGTEMEKVVREEKFLKEEPERLESALRRCKKLTGTLVTLKRLASVQEQRLPCSATAADGRLSPTEPTPITPTSAQHSKPAAGPRMGSLGIGGDAANSTDSHQRPENALDALLDELQTFSKPHTVNTQIPQVSYPPDSTDPPSLPAKGIQPLHTHPPSMHEIGRKGSMDSATLLPTQTLTVSTATGSLRRLHSYPSGSDTDNSPPIQPIQRGGQLEGKQGTGKPPLPERNADLLQQISTKRVPPPPPPRTSSKSPLASPTSPSLPPRSPASNLQHIQNVQNMVENKPQSQFEAATQNLGLGTLRRNIQNRSSLKESNNKSQTLPRNIGSNLQVHNITEGENAISASNSSSCESVNSQDGTKKRKEELEQRHQELLKKQKALQEQYARLQQLQRGTNTLAVIPPAPDQLLKKTGSESNILQKMGLQLTTSQMTGSLTNLPIKTNANQQNNNTTGDDTSTSSNTSSNTTNKVYETDIL